MTSVESVIIFTTRNKFLSLSGQTTIYQDCVFCINEEDQNGRLNQYVNQGNLQNCYVHYTGLAGGKIITSGSIQDQFSNDFKKTENGIEIDKTKLYEKLYGLSYSDETLGINHDSTLKVEDNTNQLGVDLPNIIGEGLEYNFDRISVRTSQWSGLMRGPEGVNLKLQQNSGLVITPDGVRVDDYLFQRKLTPEQGISLNQYNQIDVKIPDLNSGLQKDNNGLDIKLPASNSGLQKDANGLDVKLDSNGGLTTSASGLGVKAADTVLNVGADGLSLLTVSPLGRDDDGKLTLHPEALSGPGIKTENGHLALDVGYGLVVDTCGLRKNAESTDALISTVRDGVEYTLYFSHGCQQAFRWDGKQLFEIWHTDDTYVSGAKVDAIVIKNKVYVGWCILNVGGGISDHHIIEYSFDTKTFLKKERDVDQTNNTSMFRLLAYNDELYITKQYSNTLSSYLYKFNSSLQTGSSLHGFPSRNPARIYKVVVVNGYAYLIGGAVGSDSSNLVYRLNMSTFAGESWTMTYGTINPVVLVHGNYIFVYSGTDYSGTALSYLQRIDTATSNGGIIAVNTGIANGAIWIDGETIRIHGQTGKSFSLNLGVINETDSTSWSAAKIQTITQSGCVDAPVNSNQITHRSGQFQYVSITGQVSGVRVQAANDSIDVSSSGVSVKLPTTNPGLQNDANGLDVKLPSSNSGLQKDTNGLDVKIPTSNSGLQKTTNGLDVKIPTSNSGLQKTANGLDVKIPTSNSGLQKNDNGLDVKLSPNSGLWVDTNGLYIDTTVIQQKILQGYGISMSYYGGKYTISVNADEFQEKLEFDPETLEINEDGQLTVIGGVSSGGSGGGVIFYD